MSDENQKRCNLRSDFGSVSEMGDPSPMNNGDEDPENDGRQGGWSQRLRGSQKLDADSQLGTGRDESDDY
ncbi:MAG TPA: hypothetical protein VGV68_01165 [Terriglobia bacterium]|nr:hypothetical protein [Terriglobia bacterium]